jgi:hypothetical protein
MIVKFKKTYPLVIPAQAEIQTGNMPTTISIKQKSLNTLYLKLRINEL